MSHTVHPYGFRISIIRDWKNRWFDLKNYRDYLYEDTLLRGWLKKKLREFYVGSFELERSPGTMHIIVKTSRPGLLIGRGGGGSTRLREEIILYVKRIHRGTAKIPNVKLTIEEIKNPEADAYIIAYNVAQALEKRTSFRRVLKQATEKAANNKEVKGIKISLSGRLDGSEMARHEWLRKGTIPLQNLRADIDFVRERAHLPYGDIGIKVWVYKGEIFDKKAESKGGSAA